jgi:hypothetical protein
LANHIRENRLAFEDWYRQVYAEMHRTTLSQADLHMLAGKDGRYVFQDTRLAWETWQAAVAHAREAREAVAWMTE